MSDDEDATRLPDPDRTILVPSPPRWRETRATQAKVAVPAAAASPSAPAIAPHAGSGINPLVAAANPLLDVIGPLQRAPAQLRSPQLRSSELRFRLAQGIRDFEARARAAGISQRKTIAARYLLCAFLDEVVLATPWGAASDWREHSLLHEFHSEGVRGGEKAFELLARLSDAPADNADLLALFSICISLGFEGRYRGQPNARSQLDAITAGLAPLLEPGRTSTPDEAIVRQPLSLRWAPAVTERNPLLAVLPLWVVGVAGCALLLVAYLAISAHLNTLAGSTFQKILSVPGQASVVASAPAGRARLAPLVRADVQAGVVTVRDEALHSVITVPADALFAGQSAELAGTLQPALGRIARALAAPEFAGAQIVVVGHTDSLPIHSIQYPSNWHLSRARARAVLAQLAQEPTLTERIRNHGRAEGRAEVEPIAGEDTPASRALNRRIEIVLQLPRPDA